MRIPLLDRIRGRSSKLAAYSRYGGLPPLSKRLDEPWRSQDEPSRSLSGDLRSSPIKLEVAWRVGFRLGAFPIKVFEIDPESRRRVESLDHPGYSILRRPNRLIPRSLMIAGTAVDLLGPRGFALWEKVRDPAKGPDSPPMELWPHSSSRVQVVGDERDMVQGFTISRANGGPASLPLRDAVYFRLLPDPDDWAAAVGFLEGVSKPAQMGERALERLDEFWRRGLIERTYLSTGGRELGDDGYKRLQAELGESRGRSDSIPIIEEGEFKTMGAAPSDEAMVRGFESAAAFVERVLGASDDETTFLTRVILPIADAIEQHLELMLFEEWADRPAFPEFAFREALKGAPKDRVETHARAILTGQETPDEAREDENKPPLPDGAGEGAFIPLNLVPLATPSSGKPREKDSAGGLGGGEEAGRGTTAPARDAILDRDGRPFRVTSMRARTDRYADLRRRAVDRHAEALARRLRGEIQREGRRLAPGGRKGRAAQVGLPSLEELLRDLDRADRETARLLRGSLEAAGDAGGQNAAALVGTETDVADRMLEVIEGRAAAVGARFHAVREDALRSLLDRSLAEGWETRRLGEAILDRWGDLAVHLADGVARTEVAFAHEQAALLAWTDAGVEEFEYVFGGGPCTTGVCEGNAGGSPYRIGEAVAGDVGYSFDGADAPPVHPGCTCFVVAAIPEAA